MRSLLSVQLVLQGLHGFMNFADGVVVYVIQSDIVASLHRPIRRQAYGLLSATSSAPPLSSGKEVARLDKTFNVFHRPNALHRLID